MKANLLCSGYQLIMNNLWWEVKSVNVINLTVHSSQMSASEIPLPSPPGNSSGKMVDISESPKGEELQLTNAHSREFPN